MRQTKYHIISAAMTLKLNYQLMKADEVSGTLNHMAEEILRKNAGRQIVLVGIHRRGVPMAQRMAAAIAAKTEREPPIGVLDINLYRDDLTTVAFQPVVRRTDVPPDIDERDVILVDDVLYTGRTIRAALDALCDFGRPRGRPAGWADCAGRTGSVPGYDGPDVVAGDD